MPVCVNTVCVVLRAGRGLPTDWSPIKGVLPAVYRIKNLIKLPRSNKRALEPLIIIIIILNYVAWARERTIATERPRDRRLWAKFPLISHQTAVAADFFFNCWYSAHTKARPLSCARLSTGNVLEFICWKWKPYPRAVFRKSRLVSVLFYLYIWEVCL
jgi:hypothetical protein